MKKIFTLLIALLITLISTAQQGINYKALIKDGTGNTIAGQSITVQFTILQGTTDVYTETHSPTTDDNGIIIVNIGEGSASLGNFNAIDWGSDDHFLNVQIDTGTGLTDLGSTQFMAVPYALNAANVTGLEALDEGNGIGWRLRGRNSNNHGNIGLNAIDLSFNEFATSRGATGENSIATGKVTFANGKNSTAIGNGSTASGENSTAMGVTTIASGTNSTAMGVTTTASATTSTAMGFATEASGGSSTAMGFKTEASGNFSTAMGFETEASGNYSTAIGIYNLSVASADQLLMVGDGTSDSNRSNAFTVYAGTDASFTDHSGFVMIGNNDEQNMLFDNNEIMVRNNGSSSNLFLQNDGGDVWVGGSVVHSSDRRLKKDIQPLSYGLKEIVQLQPKAYNWKNREQEYKSLGLIAQEVQAIIKEVITTQDNDDKTLAINYTELIPVLINAVKEQQEVINNLQTKLKAKSTILSDLSQKIENIEKGLYQKKQLEIANNK